MNFDAVKTSDDIDCRAVKKNFLEKFKTGKLHKFVELVENHKDLAFCFRGNSKTEKVIIYKNNHAMFTITSGTVTFNPNYLRYCEDWKDTRLKRLYEFGYCKGKKLELGEVSTTSAGSSCSFKTAPVCSAKITDEYLGRLEDIYRELSEIFDVYFNDKKYLVDQFLLSKGIKKELCKNKKGKTEKIRQQQLFAQMKYTRSGYFFYDLEFQQKHNDKYEQDKDKNNGLSNKPDMQAIRFNDKCEPEAIVFVEVKCTESAYGGEASLEKHITSMNKYDRLDQRRREAFLIMKQYEELGLEHFEKTLEPTLFSKLPLEKLLVFTDDAIKCWKDDKSENAKYIKLKQKNGIGEVISLGNNEKAIIVNYI